jgi:hypothetical protein
MQLTQSLKGAWFQPLNLSSKKLVSKFAFEMQNLHRYNEGSVAFEISESLVGAVQVEYT